MRPIIHRFWLLLLFFLVVCQITSAQHQELKFINYTTNDGLLHNYTKKCIEDRKGFIWITTEIGLSRFDGVNFVNFEYEADDSTSLPDNTINDITVDNAGRIWVATGKGLCYYSYKTGGFTKIDISGTYSHSAATLALTFDHRNQALWFMTDKLLARLDLQNFRVNNTSCINPEGGLINQLYLSSDNRLWIAPFRQGFLIYDIPGDKVSSHMPGNWVISFHEGINNTMWLGHWQDAQLAAFNMKTNEYQDWALSDDQGIRKNMIISSITNSPFGGDSMILFSSMHMGIWLFNANQHKFEVNYIRDMFAKHSLQSDFTNYVYVDSRSIVWVCTWKGLSKMNLQEQQFRTVEMPFLNTPMFQYYNLIEGLVAAEPGAWWMGVDGCGLIKFDTATRNIIYQHLSDFSIQNVVIKPGAWTDFIVRTPSNEIWSANDEGIAQVEGEKVTNYQLLVDNKRTWRKTMTISTDKTFWISTNTHWIHFDPVAKTYQAYNIDTSLHLSVPARSVNSEFCSDGMLYAGTVSGLFKFDTQKHKSTRVPLFLDQDGRPEISMINSLATDGKETLYLGTPVGLGIYNIRTGEYVLKGEEEKVYPIMWESLLVDKAGNVWIYTPHALFKYEQASGMFTKFTTSDGIHNFSSDPSSLFSFNDNFYIGYRGAYTEFDPLKVNVNQTKVRPIITEFQIGRIPQKVDIDSFSVHTLSVSPQQNDVAFQFTGIDFTNSERITFMYKLNDDDEWHEAGTNRSISYTNLAPGYYSFEIKARNSSGLLNDTPAVFKFHIAPTLIQRWWFWPLAGLLFMATVFWFANKRIRKIREEELLKTKTNKMLAELETKLLRSQMNPHFIFNSLNSIQKYIWENKEEDAAEYLARFAKLIRAILENSRKEFITLYEEIEVLKLYIELEHRRSNGKFDYNLRVSEDIQLNEVLVPPLLLQPYIENAIWHGVNKKPGHGNISIDISKKDELLEITIDDDGVGRNFNQAQRNLSIEKQTSMGTDITLQRIQHLQTKSSIGGVRFIDKVVDGTPEGTTVVITIPVKQREHA